MIYVYSRLKDLKMGMYSSVLMLMEAGMNIEKMDFILIIKAKTDL